MSNRPAYGPNQLTPSSLCFGTMQFGAGADETDSAAMYHACREAGINFLIQPLYIIRADPRRFLVS